MMSETQQQIFGELVRSLEILGAESDLLCVVGSFQDTLPDETVLTYLREWNAIHDISPEGGKAK